MKIIIASSSVVRCYAITYYPYILNICLGHDIEQPQRADSPKQKKKHNKLNGSVQRWRHMTKKKKKAKKKKKKEGKIDAYCLRCAIRFVLKNVQIVVQSVNVLESVVGIFVYNIYLYGYWQPRVSLLHGFLYVYCLHS